jgi:hypothetical protein
MRQCRSSKRPSRNECRLAPFEVTNNKNRQQLRAQKNVCAFRDGQLVLTLCVCCFSPPSLFPCCLRRRPRGGVSRWQRAHEEFGDASQVGGPCQAAERGDQVPAGASREPPQENFRIVRHSAATNKPGREGTCQAERSIIIVVVCEHASGSTGCRDDDGSLVLVHARGRQHGLPPAATPARCWTSHHEQHGPHRHRRSICILPPACSRRQRRTKIERSAAPSSSLVVFAFLVHRTSS